MASLNKVMLIGNLTRDPEVRYTPKGSAVADLGIAVNRTYVTDSGEKMQETTYVDVVVWSRLAELASQYLHKGSPVYIEGRLQMDTWEDKQSGQKRTKLRVVADNLQFLGRRDGAEEGGAPSGGGYEGGAGAAPQQRSYPAGGGGFPRSSAPRPAGGGGGGFQRSAAPPQRQAPPQTSHEDFGEGPITEGLDDDEIPF